MAVNAVDSILSPGSVHAGCADAESGACTMHRLRIGGADPAWTVAAGSMSCTLSDIVPLAFQVAEALITRAAQRERSSGRAVPCRKGCSACCHFLTPVSIPEAWWLWRRLQSLPSPRREQVVSRFLEASKRILESDLPVGRDQSDADSASPNLERLSGWYESLHLSCPLLEGKVCGAYDWRPLACREYAVVSDPSECGLKAGRRTRLALGVSVAESLSELSQEYCGGGAMLLPLVPAWASSHANDIQASAPAGEWVERLFDVMRRRAGR